MPEVDHGTKHTSRLAVVLGVLAGACVLAGGVFVAPAVKRAYRAIVATPNNDEYPVWSRDGSRIAFQRYTWAGSGHNGVWTVSLKTGDVTKVTDEFDVDAEFVRSFVRDFELLSATPGCGERYRVYSREGPDLGCRRKRDVVLDSRIPRGIASRLGFCSPLPDLIRSPDGKWLAFSDLCEDDIWVVSADGRTLRQLTSGSST